MGDAIFSAPGKPALVFPPARGRASPILCSRHNVPPFCQKNRRRRRRTSSRGKRVAVTFAVERRLFRRREGRRTFSPSPEPLPLRRETILTRDVRCPVLFFEENSDALFLSHLEKEASSPPQPGTARRLSLRAVDDESSRARTPRLSPRRWWMQVPPFPPG